MVSKQMRWQWRFAWLVVAEIILALICVNLTEAGVVPEDFAEMMHGSVSTIISLWAFGYLQTGEKGRD